MRIAIAGPSGGYGGLEVHTRELCVFLATQDHELLHLQVFPSHPGLLGKAAKIFFWIFSISRVRAFRPDLIVAVGFGQGYSLMSRLAGSNCFRILQIVTDDFSSHTTGFHSILASFDAIGAQTPALKQAVESASGSPPPVAVLPCFHQIAVVPSSIPSGPPVELGIRLAYFGRLARNKGLHLLLQAIDQLAVPSLTTLDLWGTGPVQLELEQMLYNFPSIASCVSLKGQYPCDREYIELLASYHGLILPSQACEGLPLVLLEAASVGLPILTTRVGGIGDFAEGNPDVLTIDLGLPALRAGLKGFLAQIHRQSFQRSRQQTYFARHYSRTTIEQSWSLILCDAPRFFGIDNGSTPHISHP